MESIVKGNRMLRKVRGQIAAVGLLVALALGLCGGALAATGGAPRLAAGGGHTCVVMVDGTAQCWGDNGSGQLGDATTIDRAAPVAVQGLVSASAIATGAAHSCAALSNGHVECWGNNYAGQLGDGTLRNSSTPVGVHGIGSAVSVSAADQFSCALLRNGKAKCWGYDADGQLGNTRTSERPQRTPVLVRGLAHAVQISSAGNHSCALLASGLVKCWGSDPYSQLGYETPRAVRIRGIAGATAVAAGGGGIPGNLAENDSEYSCAVVEGGRIRCWGDNRAGQLGDGSRRASRSPVLVTGVQGATDVAAGVQHACAIVAGGNVVCWGDDRAGELGNGSVARYSAPVAVDGVTGAIGLAAGGNFGSAHSCVLLSTTAVECWGDNHFGQLGDGSTVQSSSPVTALPGVPFPRNG